MMDENDILHLDPKVICTCRDVKKLTDVAKSAGDTFLELVKLLPSPILVNSKVYESLEAIRRVPIECVTKSYADVGVQVDFNQDPETIIEEANTCDEHEIINIPSDTHLYGNTETTQDIVDKSHNIMETKQYGDSSTNQCPAIYKHHPSECDTSNVESDREIGIDNDTEPTSMSSNNDSTRTLEHYSDTEDTVFNTDPNDALDVSNEVGSHDALGKQNTNETNRVNKIKIEFDTNKTTENSTKMEIQQSPVIVADEEKTPPNSTSELNKASSMGDSILNFVKPKNYKPKPRDVKIFGSEEDAMKCLEIASKAMTELKYDKAKRMAQKAERIYPTPDAIALLERIRIVTEAREEAIGEERAEKAAAVREAAKTLLKKQKKEAAEVARKAHVKAIKEDARNVLNHQNSNFKINLDIININIEKGQEALGIDCSENAHKPSGADSLKRNADPDQVSLDASKKRRADGLISAAQVAFSKGDITRAEQLAKKAYKLNSSEEMNKFLEQIRNKVFQINAEKKENVDVIKKTCENQSETDRQSDKILDGNENLNKLDAAFGLIVQARTEIGNKNMKKAEEILVHPIDIHSTESADKLFREVCKFAPKHDQNIKSYSSCSTYEKAQTCMKFAETAAKDKYFNRAGYFLEVAMNAISAEDFDKAKRFLQRAEMIEPTEKAKELLEDVQEGLKRQKIALANEEKAAPLLSLAMTAVDKELYELAEVLLMNAWIKYKNGTAEKLIKQVRDIVVQLDAANAGKEKKKNKDSRQILDEHKQIAAECIKEARDMITEGHLESAECVLIIAQNTYATIEAYEMLTSVRINIDFEASGEQRRSNTKQWKYSNIFKEGIKGRDAFKCNNYVQMAQRAYETGDYNVAKEFLLEAEKLFPLKDIKKLIKQVDEAKKLIIPR